MESNFDVDNFITMQTDIIKKTLGNEKAIIAVSGGVDSTTCAALTRKAVGKDLVCVFIDTGFMRLKEPEKVKRDLAKSPLKLPLKIIRAKKRFIRELQNLIDAEEKRKKFRETFYLTLADAARKYRCKWLVQGTIAPDLIETEGGVKTQHNVLEQIGINPEIKFGFKVIEPLATLYKPQVRLLSKKLGFSIETSERQPFPGPGLSVRCVGSVSNDKLTQLKKATAVVEKELKDLDSQQYFAAIVENVMSQNSETHELEKTLARLLHLQEDLLDVSDLSNLATGVTEGRRIYGKIAAISLSPTLKSKAEEILPELINSCSTIIDGHTQYSRLLLEVKSLEKRKGYAAIIRAIKTDNFISASVLPISWNNLISVSSKILRNCSKISTVYYDLAPKPPATIEFE